MTAARNPGPVPELAWLPVDKITVDRAYQRSMESRASQKLVERIAADFQWSAFQAILACPTDGGGWLVLDGQHRVEAARRSGIGHVPAVVVLGGSVAEQARAFVRANLDRVALNQYALFHARISAEDPQALAVKRVADAVGISIPRNSTPRHRLKPGQTLALGGIAALVTGRGEEFAGALLAMIATACAGTSGMLTASLMRACTKIADGDLGKVEAIGRVLGRTSIEKFLAFCAARRKRGDLGEAESIEAELRSRLVALSSFRPAAASMPPKEIITKLSSGNGLSQKSPSKEINAAPARRPVAVATPAPVSSSAAQAEEERLKAEFIASNGIARIAGEVKSVATTEQALEALKELGVKAIIGNAYTVVHGKRVPTSQLVELTNRMLAQQKIVRVKPGEQVPA